MGGAMQDGDKSQDPNGNETSYPDSPDGPNMLSSGGDGMAAVKRFATKDHK